MEGTEFVSLSDTGDRTIIAGDAQSGQRIYKVQSLVMTMTSPVWKAMFNPDGFLEGNPDVPVEFPDDHPNVLLNLLRIVHFQNGQVPKELPSFDWLVEIAVLCDKYDTVNAVRPHLENWMRPWIQFCLEPGYEHWLFIAWTFGCQKIFDTLAATLILDTEVHSNGNIKRSQNVVSSEAIPQDGTMPLEAWISRDTMPPDILGRPSLFNYTSQNEIGKLGLVQNTFGYIIEI
jgi:hypothetical protein